MRYFKSNTQETNLTADINETATTVAVASVANYPTVPFTLVIDPDLATQEIVEVTAISGLNLTVTRNIESTGAFPHDNGAKVRHMVTGRDLQEPQVHMAATANVHGVTGDLVGATQSQTLTNKTIVSPTISGTGTIAASSVSSSTVTASALTASTSATLPAATSIGTVSATELGYVDGVTSAIQTQLDGKQPLDADLTALAGLATAGLVVRTGAGTVATRSLIEGVGIDITNADGILGNPSVSLSTTVPIVKTGSFTVTFDGAATPSGSRTVNFSGATYSNGSFLSTPTVILQTADARYILSVTARSTTNFEYSARQYEAASPSDSITGYYVAIGS